MEQKVINQATNLDEAIEFYLKNKIGILNCIYGDYQKEVDCYQDAASFFLTKKKEIKKMNEENVMDVNNFVARYGIMTVLSTMSTYFYNLAEEENKSFLSTAITLTRALLQISDRLEKEEN